MLLPGGRAGQGGAVLLEGDPDPGLSGGRPLAVQGRGQLAGVVGGQGQHSVHDRGAGRAEEPALRGALAGVAEQVRALGRALAERLGGAGRAAGQRVLPGEEGQARVAQAQPGPQCAHPGRVDAAGFGP